MSQLVSSFVPGQARAIMTELERDILALGPDNQTSADTNTINGAYHRYVGGGTDEVIELADFQRARYALQKAAVPLTNLVAIVDPSVEMTLSTLSNLTTLDSNPRWEGIVRDGMSETGMQFRFNIYGWDVYTSEYLKKNTGTEAISGVTAPVGSVNNLFFSAAPGVSPFVGNMRQAPMVDSEYNKDLQRDEYVTTARWGLGLLRPENLVTVVTALDQVYA